MWDLFSSPGKLHNLDKHKAIKRFLAAAAASAIHWQVEERTLASRIKDSAFTGKQT